MTEADLEYISGLVRSGVLPAPVLDLGAQYAGYNCREVFEAAGIAYFTTDKTDTPGVNYVCDFENFSQDVFDRKFGTVLVMNVLEHTFQPIKVADAALSLVRPGGRLVMLTPTIWPIHEMPVDCYRIQPQWYEQFAEMRGLKLMREHFVFLPGGPVDSFRAANGWLAYPLPTASPWKRLRSRVIQKLFDTTGRGMHAPGNLATAAVLEVAAAS